MAPKRFTATKREPAAPIPFTIEYVRHVPVSYSDVPEERTEEQEFHCLPKGQVPVGILLDWGAQMNDDGQVPIAAIQAFMSGVLVPDDERRFDQLTHDKQVSLDVQVLVAIIQWLNEEYGDRPTVPSPSSGDGSATPGGGLPAAGPVTPPPAPEPEPVVEPAPEPS